MGVGAGVGPLGVGFGVSVVGVGAGDDEFSGFNTPVHSPLGSNHDVLSMTSSVMVEVSIGGFGCICFNFFTIYSSSPKIFGASRKVKKFSHHASGLAASESFSHLSYIIYQTTEEKWT